LETAQRDALGESRLTMLPPGFGPQFRQRALSVGVPLYDTRLPA
jgi:hypothetical protein